MTASERHAKGSRMRIAMIGTGYVGLVTGTCLAEVGNDVVCVDVDPERIATLRGSKVPFFEPRLEGMVTRNVAGGRLSFSEELGPAVRASEVIFLAVGTPSGPTGEADISQVLAAGLQVAEAADGPKVLATKSTVPVGTGDRLDELVRGATSERIDVVSNPEFLKEGNAVEDFMKPDRVVIGTDSTEARELMSDLYAPFMRTSDRAMFMDRRSAELVKYAANGLLATKISFMNEVANICEAVGADVAKVREAVGADPRIGSKFLFPGPGFGGSCFPKDVAAMAHTAREVGEPFRILEAVGEVNRAQKLRIVAKIVRRFGEDLSDHHFAVWGLAFKPGTDDVREAPALTIIQGLLDRGASVSAHDPEAMRTAAAVLGAGVHMAPTAYDACQGADALIVVTEWNQYRTPDLERIKGLLRTPVVFDGRNLYRPGRLAALGMEHYPVGRPSTKLE
jgi:UDPglucose 6-dehydrogenase